MWLREMANLYSWSGIQKNILLGILKHLKFTQTDTTVTKFTWVGVGRILYQNNLSSLIDAQKVSIEKSCYPRSNFN